MKVIKSAYINTKGIQNDIIVMDGKGFRAYSAGLIVIINSSRG